MVIGPSEAAVGGGVHHQLGPVGRLGQAGPGAQVAHVGAPVRAPREHPDLVAGRRQPGHQEPAKRSAAPGDQDHAHWSR